MVNNPSLLRSRSGRSHVMLPVPTRLLQTDIHSFLGVLRFCLLGPISLSRLVVIVYAAPITGANIRKKMKATHWLVYFRERNVCRFEAAAWGRGALRDSGPSGCEGDYRTTSLQGQCNTKEASGGPAGKNNKTGRGTNGKETETFYNTKWSFVCLHKTQFGSRTCLAGFCQG